MRHIKKAYDPHDRVQVEFPTPSLAKQSFAGECDINKIMRKFEKTGLISHNNSVAGRYGDFLSAPEYHDACNAVIAADSAFQSLPAKIRERFGNSPASFLDFAQDPENLEEMARMGLAKPPEAPVLKPEVPDGEPPSSLDDPPEEGVKALGTDTTT